MSLVAIYIASTAAMKQVSPQADPSLDVPMALGLTFSFVITIDQPFYLR